MTTNYLTAYPALDPVPQLETNTDAFGGPGGAMNTQAQALLNRLEFVRSAQALSVEDYDDIRALTSSTYNGKSVDTLGRAAALDGGQKTFIYDASDTISADDDVSVLVDGSGRRWKAAVNGAVNVRWFGAIPGVSMSAMYSALSDAWSFALAKGFDLYAPAGVYDVGAESMPWRQQVITGSLLDCKNITVFGDGPSTVFKTTSADGADVFQLNGLENFNARNLYITATLTGSAGAGSNGISVTGGWDNISLLDIWCDELPSVDKGSYVDGGKALTLQPPASGSLPCGRLVARIFAKGCAEGFGYEPVLSQAATKATSIDVHIVAEDCYRAVKIVGAEATGAIPESWSMGVSVRGQAVNCQQDAVLNRIHGSSVQIQTVTTKTAAARRLAPGGAAWSSSDSLVYSIYAAYARHCDISVTGYKGACDYKARIGGSPAGAAGFAGTTFGCDITLDIGGTAATADFEVIDSGGNTIADTHLRLTSSTATSVATSIYAEALKNTITIGHASRFVDPTVSGTLKFAQSSSASVQTGAVVLKDNQITALQGKAASGAGIVIAGLLDNSGALRLGVRNATGIVVDSLGSSAAVGAYVGKHPVFDAAGALIGYFPIYA